MQILDKSRYTKIILPGVITAITIILVTVAMGPQSIVISHAYAQTTQQPTFSTDITQDVKILTITGKDKSGNDVQIELILSRGSLMMLNPLMMSNPNWMFGMMGMMGGWGATGSWTTGPGMMGQQFQPNSQLAQQMIDWMRSQYSVQGGSLSISGKTYLIDFGGARVANDRLFMNVAVDGVKTGKIIVYGKVNADDGLKGTLLLWESRSSLVATKIQGKGTIESAIS